MVTSAYEIVSEPLEVFVAPAGTAAPSMKQSPPAPWKSLGKCDDRGVRAEQSMTPAAFLPLSGPAPATKVWRCAEQLELSVCLDCRPEVVSGLGVTALVIRGVSCFDGSYAVQYEMARAYCQVPRVTFDRRRTEVELSFIVPLEGYGLLRTSGGLVQASPQAVRAAAAQWLAEYLRDRGWTAKSTIVEAATAAGMRDEGVLERAAADLHVQRGWVARLAEVPPTYYVPETEYPPPTELPYHDEEAWQLPASFRELVEADDDYWQKEIDKP